MRGKKTYDTINNDYERAELFLKALNMRMSKYKDTKEYKNLQKISIGLPIKRYNYQLAS